MEGIKANPQNAEKTRLYLKKHKLLAERYKVFRKDSFIYFPITCAPAAADVKALRRIGAMAVSAEFEPSGSDIPKPPDGLRSGIDLLGNIAIIDADPPMARKAASVILSSNKGVTTVLRKGSAVKGVYRKRKYIYVAGKREYTARYNENGCSFTFDVRKTFFSPRLAYERKRVADASRNGENVVVMFAGIGPFAIEIAKKNPDSNVVAIELNRAAYGFMRKNASANRVGNVVPLNADVRKVKRKYGRFADRIVMPLPKDSYDFLDVAEAMAKDGCTIHYYAFGDKGSAYDVHSDKILEFFRKKGRNPRMSFWRVVRPYSPKIIEIVIDFTV